MEMILGRIVNVHGNAVRHFYADFAEPRIGTTMYADELVDT